MQCSPISAPPGELFYGIITTIQESRVQGGVCSTATKQHTRRAYATPAGLVFSDSTTSGTSVYPVASNNGNANASSQTGTCCCCQHNGAGGNPAETPMDWTAYAQNDGTIEFSLSDLLHARDNAVALGEQNLNQHGCCSCQGRGARHVQAMQSAPQSQNRNVSEYYMQYDPVNPPAQIQVTLTSPPTVLLTNQTAALCNESASPQQRCGTGAARDVKQCEKYEKPKTFNNGSTSTSDLKGMECDCLGNEGESSEKAASSECMATQTSSEKKEVFEPEEKRAEDELQKYLEELVNEPCDEEEQQATDNKNSGDQSVVAKDKKSEGTSSNDADCAGCEAEDCNCDKTVKDTESAKKANSDKGKPVKGPKARDKAVDFKD